MGKIEQSQTSLPCPGNAREIEEREVLQARVVKLHRNWTKNREYLAPPTTGKLAEIDPALIVTPPSGLEAGYVPIVTRQAATE